MAVNDITSNSLFGTSGSTSTASTSSKNEAGSADRFLKLLVTQMQNQDPLNPMDNAEVTSQMAQINTVNGIEKLNTAVANLSGQMLQLQVVQGANLVGRDVVVPGNRMDVVDGVGQGAFELNSASDAVKVEVLSASGQVVDTINLGAQDAGMHAFTWDNATSAAATSGSGLTFKVTSTLGSVATSATTLVADRVNAVSAGSGGALQLELSSGQNVGYDTVRSFN